MLFPPSETLLAPALDVEEYQLLVREKELTGMDAELSSMVGFDAMHVVGMSILLFQGVVHVNEAGG